MAFLTFEELKKSSGVASNVAQLITNLEKMDSKSFIDEREWKPTVDANGNGTAIIRFLPGLDNSRCKKYFTHAFKNPISGRWYIENCPTSILDKNTDAKCPVCEANTKLWATNDPQKQDIARMRRRQTKFVSNIYVISDPKNKEAEGHVYLFKYGTKILEKIKNAALSVFDKDQACDVFDMWAGANFRLAITMVKKQRSYDQSYFEAKSPLSNNDAVMSDIFNSQYDINEFVDPKNYLSYNELLRKFNNVEQTDVSSNSVKEYIQAETVSVPVVENPQEKYQAILDKFKVEDSEDEDIPF